MNRNILTITEEQAALYSLGMLSQTEARAFEREVADGNEAASASLNTFNRLVTELSFCAPEAAPSPCVRTRLLAQVAGVTDSVTCSPSPLSPSI